MGCSHLSILPVTCNVWPLLTNLCLQVSTLTTELSLTLVVTAFLDEFELNKFKAHLFIEIIIWLIWIDRMLTCENLFKFLELSIWFVWYDKSYPAISFPCTILSFPIIIKLNHRLTVIFFKCRKFAYL